MKYTDPLPIARIIEKALEMDNSGSQFLQQRACYLWGEVVGPNVNRLTARRFVTPDGELHVYINSAPLKQELQFVSEKIVKNINDILRTDVIKKLVIH